MAAKTKAQSELEGKVAAAEKELIDHVTKSNAWAAEVRIQGNDNKVKFIQLQTTFETLRSLLPIPQIRVPSVSIRGNK